MPRDKNKATAGRNDALAKAAERGINDRSKPRRKGMCQMFARLCVEDVYGLLYDKYIHKGTAEAARRSMIKAGFSVPLSNGSAVGDILYKQGTPGQPEGHVGIRIPGNRVAENSSVHWSAKNGARGVRSLKDFGRVDTIIRLPTPKKR